MLIHVCGLLEREMWELKYEDRLAQQWRIADIVCYPKTEFEVVQLVKLAADCNVVLVLYGGGTSKLFFLMRFFFFIITADYPCRSNSFNRK